MSSIKEAVPDVSPAVLALALHEARWDVTAAVQLVGLFMQARGSMLEELKKVLLCPAHLLSILCIFCICICIARFQLSSQVRTG